VEDGELGMLSETHEKSMSSAAAAASANVEYVLSELDWLAMLDEIPNEATGLVFRLLGETGTHAGVINDVVLAAAGEAPGGALALPYTGGRWVIWERTDGVQSAMDPELPVRITDAGTDVPLARGRLALGWWLVGSARAMLTLARQHAVDRVQFGRPIGSFQAVRHRLAETLVAIEGAEATLLMATEDGSDLACSLGKAAAGRAALTAAKNCQQVLGGIGFTDEHDLHRHVKRVFVLDGLLGSARELTREAGAAVRSLGHAPRLGNL
jgi:hypothetical protein